MYFDFKIDQPVPKYQAEKVKFPQFTWFSLDATVQSQYCMSMSKNLYKGTMKSYNKIQDCVQLYYNNK